MTEKRFVIKNERTIIDNETGRSGYVFSWKSDAKEICDLLNDFVDENEQLKSELAAIKRQEQEVIEYLRAYHKGDVKELKE